jgi:hypothetical protein
MTLLREKILPGLLFLFCICLVPLPGEARETPPALTCLNGNLQRALLHLDRNCAKAARQISVTGLEGKETRAVLRKLCALHYSIYDCVTIDAKGRIVAVEPPAYKKAEGKDISTQEQVVRLQRTKKPVLSLIFRAVEGVYAADLEYPVFSPSGSFMGSVSILFRPESLIASVVTDEIKGLPLDVWALQCNGRLLFALDPGEVGRNLVEDPLYKRFPGLVSMAKEMVQKKAGKGAYTLIGDKQHSPSEVDVCWGTSSLHGTEWRLALSKVRSPARKLGTRTYDEMGIKSMEDALRALACEEKLKSAMASGKNEDVYALFKAFFHDYGTIYSIQWIDEKGLNRFGYPEENSLINYDCTAPGSMRGVKMMKTLSRRREASFDTSLVEGRKGRVLMVPVQSGGRYMGMIYTICIKP